MTRQRVVCLVGPTASGKTALALDLAAAFDAEVVSADSRQIYRDLDVGTAKPTGAERERAPHHCLDLVDPGETFDAGRFRDAAAAALTDIHTRGKRALVVGGTGLYLRVLLRGLCPAPPRVPALRRVLHRMAAEEGAPVLHRRLAVVDPVAATRIHPNDTVRAVRALEVALSTGRRLSDWQAAHGFTETPYDALVIGLAVPPAELDARIAARARAMVDAGFADEVRRLLARGLDPEAPAWGAVGYREMRAHVQGLADAATTLAAIVRSTRRFAKRQRTWFRSEPNVVWRDPERERSQIRDDVATAFGAVTRVDIANVGSPR